MRRLQDFITNYSWDHEGMLGAYQQAVTGLICAPGGDEGMLNVDSSEFAKKGKESVGVARQYCGNLGKVENCQSGVFLGYAGERGYGLLDCRLYLPQKWLTEEYAERRRKCQIPHEVEFLTKIQIARELIRKVDEGGFLRPRWVGCDCTFGSSWEFLDEVGHRYWYFANVHSNTPVWLKQPRMRVPLPRKRQTAESSEGCLGRCTHGSRDRGRSRLGLAAGQAGRRSERTDCGGGGAASSDTLARR